MVFYTASAFPAEYKGDAFVALHGSWNRKVRTGYKVVRVTFKDGKPTGEYQDFITGWLPDEAPCIATARCSSRMTRTT